jgi:hypothetical protein
MAWQRTKPQPLVGDQRTELYLSLHKLGQWRHFARPQMHQVRAIREHGFLARHGEVAAASSRLHKTIEKYGRTRLVTSFGAADGGAQFITWLRDEVMVRKHWSERNAVYIDVTALADLPGTEAKIEDVRGLRGAKRTSGRPTSQNANWSDYYQYALAMADSMLFVFTAAWFQSPWCGRELNYFVRENDERRKHGAPPLKGIALAFAKEGAPPTIPGMTTIQATKQYLVEDEAARLSLESGYHDAFIIDQRTLQRVVDALA